MSLKIAFGGNMGSGKDHAGNYLKTKYGGSCVSFAGPIYDILHYAQDRCKIVRHKDRRFLQLVGTEWGRSIDPSLWIDLLLSSTETEGENYFVTDLRFENEFYTLKNKSWICIKIVRESDSSERVGTGSLGHSSELSLKNIPSKCWDYTIYNNGSVEEFENKLDQILMSIIQSQYLQTPE